MNPLTLQAYSPYGFHQARPRRASLVNFNGERLDRCAGVYLLGNGYRGFSPALMRFSAPDSWSPFGAGGLNAYAYCAGDPLTNSDPSGHKFFSRRSSTTNTMKLLSEERQLINSDQYLTPPQARVQAETSLLNRVLSEQLNHLRARVQAIDQARSFDQSRNWAAEIAQSNQLNVTVGHAQATDRVRGDFFSTRQTPVVNNAIGGQLNAFTPGNDVVVGAVPIPTNVRRPRTPEELNGINGFIRLGGRFGV